MKDVSKIAREVGLKQKIAVSDAVWQDVVLERHVRDSKIMYENRLRYILWSLMDALEGDEGSFVVRLLVSKGDKLEKEDVRLRVERLPNEPGVFVVRKEDER